MLGALFGFNGRLSRPGFWEVLFSIVLIDVLLVLGRMYVADSGLPGGFGPASALSQALLAAIPWALGAFTIWSLLAAMVKRCHDRGRTGALILIGLIPVIGWLWLLVDLFVLEGEERKNCYGRPPHSPVVEEAPRPRVDWGAEPAPAPEPAFAAAPAEPPAPEPLSPEPHELAPTDAGDVDVHVPEIHAEPEPLAAWPEDHVPMAEAPPVHEPEPEPIQPEPEALHAEEPAPEPPAEAAEDHQPELSLEMARDHHREEPRPTERDRSDPRPLMLDSL